MTYTLVIMLFAGSYDGGVAIDKITGFTTKKACVEASQTLPETPVGGWVQTVKSYCIEVK